VGRGRAAHDLDSSVPRTRGERVLGNEVPVHAEHLALVLLPALHGELRDGDVEELDGAVAAADDDLVLVGLGPGGVEEGVLGIISIAPSVAIPQQGRDALGNIRLLSDDAVRRQVQDV